MQTLIAGLMVWVANTSGYTAPAVQPELQTTSHQQLVDTLCGGMECSALAYYDDKQNTIFYDQSLLLEQTVAQSIIVHEMVHVLQYRNHAVPEQVDCTKRMALEQEAYIIQRRFLRERHQMTYQVDLAIRMLKHVCQ